MIDIFLICPVRNVSDDEQELINSYIVNLESKGKNIYWPFRDTNQNDKIGYRICSDNKKAIKNAKEIHIWWSENSQGSLFDLGIAWGLDKPLKIVNKDNVKRTPHKSFSNVILQWDEN